MRLEQLNYFVEVARCQSIKGASENLFLTQQSLSQTLKNLEKELGFLLLHRTTAGITLTEEGKIFLKFAETVLAEQEDFWQQIALLQHQADEQLQGMLQFNIFLLYNICVLPEMLNQFCLRYPNVAVNTTMMSLPAIEESFQIEQEDLLGLITLPSADVAQYSIYLRQRGLQLQVFAKSRYMLCCNKEHPLLKKRDREISLEKVMQYPIVQYSVDRLENDTLHKLLSIYGYEEEEYALSVQSMHTWVANLLRGEKIGFLNELIYADRKNKQKGFEDIVALQTKEALSGTLACIVRQKTSPLVQKFMAFLPELDS